MLRNERFSADFTLSLDKMLDALSPCVVAHFKDHREHALELNTSIANFLKVIQVLFNKSKFDSKLGETIKLN
jgi:hypothetical protein